MNDTLTRYIQAIPNLKPRRALELILRPLIDRLSTRAISNSTLVITATSGKFVPKTGAADSYFLVKGTLVMIAAGTDMPALPGTITAALYNVYCFFVDTAGTLTVAKGTEGAAIGNIVFPAFPEGKALVGFIIVTYASTFTGGSTALDTATTLYFSPVGGLDPSALLGN